MEQPRFDGRISGYNFNEDFSDATISIDSRDPKVAFKVNVALIPVLVATLKTIAENAEMERRRRLPESKLRLVAPLVPERIGAERDTSDGTIQLTFQAGGSFDHFQLDESVARELASLLAEVADQAWQRETSQ
jgi:hypothetical protein